MLTEKGGCTPVVKGVSADRELVLHCCASYSAQARAPAATFCRTTTSCVVFLQHHHMARATYPQDINNLMQLGIDNSYPQLI